MGVTEDTVFIMQSVLATGIVLGMGYYLLLTISAYDQFDSPTADIVKENFTYLDGIVVFGTVLLFAASIVLAYFVPTHPAFFFTYFLTAVLVFILAPIFSNVYATVATNPLVGSAFDAFPLTALVIGNLPILGFVLSGLIAIASYGKRLNQASYV